MHWKTSIPSIFILSLLIGIATSCLLNNFFGGTGALYKDSISSNLATYASITLGFLLTGFTVLMIYSEKASFQGWKESGHFTTWRVIYVASLLVSMIVLVFAFLILKYPELIKVSFGFLAMSLSLTIFSFIPIFCLSLKL